MHSSSEQKERTVEEIMEPLKQLCFVNLIYNFKFENHIEIDNLLMNESTNQIKDSGI